LALLLAWLALPSATARAGAWTQLDGEHYLKVWVRSIFGDRLFQADGDTAQMPDGFREHSLDVHAEYGIDDFWTLVAAGRPLGWATVGDESTLYVGPLSLGVRRALLRRPVRVAAEVHYGYAPPLGDEVLASGSAGGEPFVYAPVVETHRVDGLVSVGYGLPWGWTTAQAGARWSSDDGIDPALMGLAQLGVDFDFGLTAAAYVAAYEPLGEVEVANASGAGQTRYVGFGIDVSYWFDYHWAVNVGIASAFLAESNAAAAPINVGFEHR
jgi:hypothetical protein